MEIDNQKSDSIGSDGYIIGIDGKRVILNYSNPQNAYFNSTNELPKKQEPSIAKVLRKRLFKRQAA